MCQQGKVLTPTGQPRVLGKVCSLCSNPPHPHPHPHAKWPDICLRGLDDRIQRGKVTGKVLGSRWSVGRPRGHRRPWARKGPWACGSGMGQVSGGRPRPRRGLGLCFV